MWKSSINVQDYSFHSLSSFLFIQYKDFSYFLLLQSWIICSTWRVNHHWNLHQPNRHSWLVTHLYSLVTHLYSLINEWPNTSLFFFCLQDFKEQIIHHVATTALISFSWLVNYIRAGTLIMLVHDASDYFMEVWQRVLSWNNIFIFLMNYFLNFSINSVIFFIPPMYVPFILYAFKKFQSCWLFIFYPTSVFRHFFFK